ncbi:DMT family transporter [Kineococcus arenarius]|uniref:DMT family transporter n=1 Tax=unclassified Kineococcus TaxID=2621656 RepID=UPI003D7DFF55
MNRWVLLVGAVLSEVSASLSLKAALGHPGWYVVVVAGYAGAFTLLSRVLRAGMPLGVAYGTWSAAGVALTATLSSVVFGESLGPVALAGIGLIIAGVLAVELGSQRGREQEER